MLFELYQKKTVYPCYLVPYLILAKQDVYVICTKGFSDIYEHIYIIVFHICHSASSHNKTLLLTFQCFSLFSTCLTDKVITQSLYYPDSYCTHATFF